MKEREIESESETEIERMRDNVKLLPVTAVFYAC